MPELTPTLCLKKPLGHERVTRAAYNENLELIDQSLASHNSDSNAHNGLIGKLIQYGSTTIADIPANTVGSITITFPKAFSTAPKVFVTAITNDSKRMKSSVETATTTNFTCCRYNENTATCDLNFDWLAIGE